MGKVQKQPLKSTRTTDPPSGTLEGRENQLISLAVDLAEQQLRDGTASAQVITHYLKLGSTKDKMEKEIMAEQIKLLTAKTEALKSAKHVEELYAEAMQAFRRYSGQETVDENIQ